MDSKTDDRPLVASVTDGVMSHIDSAEDGVILCDDSATENSTMTSAVDSGRDGIIRGVDS